MNTFTKVVMVGMMLFLVLFSIVTVILIFSAKNEYFYSLDYSVDPTGVYQIRYDISHNTLRYGRTQACAVPGSGTPGPACVHVWVPACVSKKRLIAQRYWPVTRVGRLSLPQDEFPVYRPPQKARPHVLLVGRGTCYLEFPLVR